VHRGWIVVQWWLLPSIREILSQKELIGSDDKVAVSVEQATVIETCSIGATSHRTREGASPKHRAAAAKAQREWQSAIATLEQLLLPAVSGNGSTSHNPEDSSKQGLILAGPAPVLSDRELLASFETGIFTNDALNPWNFMPFQLPPAQPETTPFVENTTHRLPLFPGDPLVKEQFCLVFTKDFSLVMVSGEDHFGVPGFQFSFDPEDIQRVWASLRCRLLLSSSHHLKQLEALMEKFVPKPPDYRIVMNFGRGLLKNLPELPSVELSQTIPVTISESTMVQPRQPQDHRDKVKTGSNSQNGSSSTPNALKQKGSEPNWQRLVKNEARGFPRISIVNPKENAEARPDLELLRALTHEIRTPLTTIHTLTKLLLRRRDLPPEVMRRIEIIDHECSEQINRMELIFRAVELETKAAKQTPVSLTSISLTRVFDNSIPRWQKQAQRRNLTLDVVLPQQLPTVVSHPALLDQVLTGLMENFTRSIPTGGHIQLQVTPAGNQLKLQFQSQIDHETIADDHCPTLKSLGQLLTFQPETGSISLNLNVTKNLFQALGGKLIVKQRPQQGEVMTVFLPLADLAKTPLPGIG